MNRLGFVALLADGRFPVGGHAHSVGFEAAATDFDLNSESALVQFVEGRLQTVGVTEARLVAALHSQMTSDSLDWDVADQEITARIASPALRSTSRLLGRQWVRAGREVFGTPLIGQSGAVHDKGPHQVMAFAELMVDVGINVVDALELQLHHLVSTITTAAIRLHGIDPYRAAAIQARSVDRFGAIIDSAVHTRASPWHELDAPSSPLADILAERHAAADMRLFRS